MATNQKLEFRVTTDKDGAKLKLNDMPIHAAKAFLTLYESLVNIVELTGDSNTTKISITQSSLGVSVLGGAVPKMYGDFESIIESKCDNGEIVKQWRFIQDLFKSNGLGYDASYYDQSGIKEPLVDKIKESKKFHAKVTRKKYDSAVRFFSGKLIEVGGKNPNIHIDFGGNKIKVSCTEYNADLAKDFLYKNILISAWVKKAPNAAAQYELCDVYESSHQFMDFKSFFEKIKELDELPALSYIHDRIQEYLEGKQFNTLIKISRVWNHITTDIPTLKTFLVITKDFKGHSDFGPFRASILDKYNFKMQKYKRSNLKRINAK